ncbi:exonuclease subunit SbcD [Cetobacterium sp. 2A]|uniref:metallophosphoesterase family protein n=1 Tax=Cetobacterium sp. 2A TaxID=2754723 RepID=UPI00163C94D7|nr:exonuclease subunit SbcD [Cetobacterium sp. 2A]
MKILHTSDWHLGKKLEGNSRIDEQIKFLDSLNLIVNGEEIDLILISGDIYDVPNPPVEAEKLFYTSMERLSNNGKRGIIIIPGNHDNPEKLIASQEILQKFGIIVFEKPFERKNIGKYGDLYILESNEGSIELEISGEKIFLYALPYPSEKSLNEEFNDNNISYSKRIGEIITEGLKMNTKDLPSVVMTHIYVNGSKGDGDERSIELGGSLAVSLDDMPQASYTALGHIHRSMIFKDRNIAYSGSPIEYRLTENKYSKKVLTAEISKDKTTIKEIEIDNYKPIKKYIVKSIDEALNKSKELEEKDEWIYLIINSERALESHEVHEILKNKNVVEIIPQINFTSDKEGLEIDYTSESISKAFERFYIEEKGIEPPLEIMDIFLELVGEDE